MEDVALSSVWLIWTEKVSPGATSRLGTDMEAVPPGEASCATTRRVTLRTRLTPELRRTRVG